MEELAREIAAMPRIDPRRLEMAEEFARLNMLAESVKKKNE